LAIKTNLVDDFQDADIFLDAAAPEVRTNCVAPKTAKSCVGSVFTAEFECRHENGRRPNTFSRAAGRRPACELNFTQRH
jgi:hypothetical protein